MRQRPGLSGKAWLPLRTVILGSLAGLALPAQTRITGDIVEVRVKADTVSTVKTQPAARHWVLADFPTDQDVRISDPAVRRQVLDALDKFRAAASSCDHIILDGKPGDRCGFVANVAVPAILLKISGPAEILRAPQATVPPQAVPITLKGSWNGVPVPAPVQKLCIWVAIGPFTGTCSAPDASTTTLTLKDLSPAAGLGSLPPQYEAIQIRTKAPDQSPKTTAQLQAIAITAFLTARKLDMLPVPPGATNTPLHTLDLRNALGKIYNIEDSGWPDVRVTFIPLDDKGPDAGVYVLSISNLQRVGHASVVLTPGQQTDAAFQEKLAEASCRVENRFQAQLTALEGVIPTNDSVWKIARAIGASDQVTGVVIPQKAAGKYVTCNDKNKPNLELGGPADNRIEFKGDHRWVIGSLNGDLTAGVSGSPHDIVTGTGKISEDHRLFPTSETFEDTASLSLNAGPETQRSGLSFNIEGTAGSKRLVNYGLGFDAVFFRDGNQRFGYLAGPKFVDEEYGPTPKAYFAFARPAEAYAFTASIRVEGGLQFHHVAILPPSVFPPFLNHGWVSGYAPSLATLIGYDFAHTGSPPTASAKPDTSPHGGLGKLFLTVNAGELLARKSLAGDFQFNRYTVRAQGEIFFGATSRQDFVIRYGRGVTASSAGTPLFELPQLGGADNLRGIEIGEYVSRGFGFDQSEAGINALSVWGWLHKKKDQSVKAAAQAAATGNTPPKTPTLSSLGIESIFVAALYDRARLATGSSIGPLLDLAHGFHGSGIKGEIRGLRAGNHRANLSFIYARSPDSVLHHKGVFITSVSLDF